MMAGHAVLKVFAGFAGVLGWRGHRADPRRRRDLRAGGAGVAIQAYVFTILTAST
jgi:F0F1-type ATP synthase membrane subunit a